ncbi:hypothetical protein ACJ72_04540 [Emergomyces africanus]|uniref:Inner kinetochore subunit AME1 domain-containing protein n=1 Tax=Emergomyces africanus TaxID=1955775 RepID=A0A1B7NWF9_9EURO|nr:hypothetical protein ACJ72_04540 [Emergomyces africanus]
MAMASNREERRLMRQRGAGNRTGKDIDFGFGSAFGTPELLPAGATTQTTQPETNVPGSQRSSSRRTPTPSQNRLTSPQLNRRTPTGSQNPSSSRKSPGGGRSSHPRRESIFDIPPDDEPDQTRENKRRKIAPFEPILEDTVLSSKNNLEPETGSTADGAQSSPDAHPRPREAGLEPRAPSAEPDTTELESQPAPDGQLETQNADSVSITKAGIQENRNSPPKKKSPSRKRKKRKSVVQGPKRPKRPSGGDQLRTRRDQEPEREREPEHESEPEPEPEPDEHNEEGDERDAGPPTEEPARPARRKPKKRKSIRQIPTKHKRRTPLVRVGRQEETGEQISGSEELDETAVDEENQGNIQDQSTSPQQTTDPKRKSSSGTQGPARQSRRRKPEEPEAVEDDAQEEPSEARPSQGKQRKRKAAEEQNAQDEPKSRGATVPVIVHRFANLSALQSITGDDEGTPIETAQPDTISDRHNKYPSRSGVNPADVLGQICRESLEKTLSILEDGIAKESNASRQGEWTRKRKAVELFGTELEQRLFDMSELLDSNFVLSARLKKEKRDVASLRNRLVELRKQREDVALRIDEVRRKYNEDEHIKTEHDNLNNSLHDLQLAIDRRRKIDDEQAANPAAGLEFLLRTVAQDVSSIASGSHGGILNQIRTFNGQLERTVALLE